MGLFKPLEYVSSWRRIAGAMWGEHQSPQVLGFDDVDMTEIERLQPIIKEKTGVKVTATHFAVKAMGTVIDRHPDLNVVMIRGQPMRRTSVDIFVQVAVKGGAGAGSADLSGIKIKNIDQKSVSDIAREIQERSSKVRAGKDKEIEDTKRMLDIMPKPVLGMMMGGINRMIFDMEIDLKKVGIKSDPFGCAMITNCSSFGVHAGFAPLVPMARTPIIFLLGRTDPKPMVIDGEIVARPMCRMCGTFDHRLLDGYQIGLICSEFKLLAEDPEGSGMDLY